MTDEQYINEEVSEMNQHDNTFQVGLRRLQIAISGGWGEKERQIAKAATELYLKNKREFLLCKDPVALAGMMGNTERYPELEGLLETGTIATNAILHAFVSTTQFNYKYDEWAGDVMDYWGVNPGTIKNKFEHWYLELIRQLMTETSKDDRTGTGTRSLTTAVYKHDLRESFPLLRSRFLKPENPGKEYIWMLSGSNNEKELAAMGVPFWSEFADETGDLGPVYGYLWRYWPNGDGTTTDQIEYVLDTLRKSPESRRAVVSCWHPGLIPDSKTPPKENYKVGKQALTPCHYAFQFLASPIPFCERLAWAKQHKPEQIAFLYPVTGSGWTERTEEAMDRIGVPKHYLDLQFNMRSSDTVLGLPANFNFYGHMCHAFAKELNMVPRFLSYTGTDVHLYVNHIKGMKEVFDWVKQNKEKVFDEVSQIKIVGEFENLYDMKPENFEYINYSRELVGPAKRFSVAV